MYENDSFELFSKDEPRIGVILGTGPSLTPEIIEQASKFRLFGVNNTIFSAPLDVHLACNIEWWDHYHDKVAGKKCHKWTWDDATSKKYGINHIPGIWGDGLSTNKNYIHYHHGAGPQMVNLAYHYGVKTMLLVGWDMRYPPGDKRHYFGEYPEPLQHWPKTGPQGEFTGLIKEMETIKPEDYDIEIFNCTPGSALTCYPFKSLSEFQNDLKL